MKLSPLPGFAFISIHGKYENTSNLIVIPERFRNKEIAYGKLHAANSNTKDFADDKTWDDYLGQRIIFSAFSICPIMDNLYRIPLTSIIAIVTDPNIVIGNAENPAEPERCRWCGPAKSGSANSMMVDPVTGYCPRCNKNSLGETRPTSLSSPALDHELLRHQRFPCRK